MAIQRFDHIMEFNDEDSTHENTINDLEYYKESLRIAENEVRTIHETTGKALKDIVGKVFETHRERVWTHFGFEVSKDKYGALFDVDWSITWQGELIALEEDKGHYMDSCFMERAITGFCKTINAYQKINKPIPVLILHSFTKYNKFVEKLEEDLETRKSEIADEMNNKLVYTTLVERDRIKKEQWFSTTLYNCYSSNAIDELILQDIEFIRSLIPSSE